MTNSFRHMCRSALFSFWILVSLIASAAAVQPAEQTPPRQEARRLQAQQPVEMGYLLYLPPKYAERDRWPLLLFLHGAGERGDDLELVKTHGPPKRIAAGDDLPFIVVSPQCPEGKWWEPTELLALLDHLQKELNVDTSRIYVTGLSMGGFGTWRLGAYAPDRIAAIAPICGGGEPFWARALSGLPVWAFHGAKDEAVPMARSEQMVEAVRRAGGDPRLTVYPDAEHDSWTVTYDNPELYKWLLEQHRSSR